MTPIEPEEIHLKRTIGMAVAVLSSFALLQGTAFAAHGIITGPSDIDIDDTAYLQADGTVVVSGTVTCSTGATTARFKIGVELTQAPDSGRAPSESGFCTGAPAHFRATVTPRDNGTFETGAAFVNARVDTGDSSKTELDRENTGESVNIVNAP